MKPRIGLLLGDPTGIGPEIVAKLLATTDVQEHAALVVIGDARIFAMGQRTAGTSLGMKIVQNPADVRFDSGALQFLEFSGPSPENFTVGQVNGQAGKSVLEGLAFALDLARDGILDAIAFAPLNKQAMHLGGCPFADELHYLADHLQWKGYVSEINVLENLWTSRVTSHVGLRLVSDLITPQAVHDAIVLIHDALRLSGVSKPRVAVAAFNPHGGEGGLFGTEEIRGIAPGIAQARSKGIQADGPFPADTIFLRAKAGTYDAIVTMYHDQGQVAMKLMGFERGVTVEGGLPLPVTTPAHGTAFDIAGQGKANPQGLYEAVRVACRMGMSRARRKHE